MNKYLKTVPIFLLIFHLFGCSLPADDGTSFSIVPLKDIEITTDTGEKPQSKVWFHDGYWWAVLPIESGTKLWRLEEDKWTILLHLSDSTNIKADTKAIRNMAHILLFHGAESELVSLEYDVERKVYKPWIEQPHGAPIELEDVSETATFDLDSSGRMWVASDSETDIHVRWSDPPYGKWSPPLSLATGISADDICAITAFPDGNIGVLWSNQNTKRFGFRIHKSGTSTENWSENEIPASDSAFPLNGGMADDHLNVAVASNGTLYAAVKTSYDSVGYPLIALLIRQPSGEWDKLYNVDDEGSRGIVLLNEKEDSVMVFYTSYRDNKIVCKTSNTKEISFRARKTIINEGEKINNVSSTKQKFNNEIVILASESGSLKSVRLKWPSGVTQNK